MWFVFPKIKGLWSCKRSRYYTIQSFDKVRKHLSCNILKVILLENSYELLNLKINNAQAILVSNELVFKQVLDSFLQLVFLKRNVI